MDESGKRREFISEPTRLSGQSKDIVVFARFYSSAPRVVAVFAVSLSVFFDDRWWGGWKWLKSEGGSGGEEGEGKMRARTGGRDVLKVNLERERGDL